MTKFDVVGFGALNVDMLFKVERLARAEEESFVEDYTEACGGSAANTTVGLARLGCKTGFIGKVADDREGKLQIDCFKTEGVRHSRHRFRRRRAKAVQLWDSWTRKGQEPSTSTQALTTQSSLEK